MDDSEADHIERLILEGLADVRLQTYQEIHQEMLDNNGDLDITAKEESYIIPWIEDRMKTGEIFSAKDFGQRKKVNSCLSPIDGITVNNLKNLLVAKVSSIK